LNVAALYSSTGEYSYRRGFSWVAIVALLAGALPSLPGFLATIKVIDGSTVPPFLLGLYNYAWFVGFGVAFTFYLTLRKLSPHG
ncbi:MAG: cytosine permease, partial [Opitutaceae bacterium]